MGRVFECEFFFKSSRFSKKFCEWSQVLGHICRVRRAYMVWEYKTDIFLSCEKLRWPVRTTKGFRKVKSRIIWQDWSSVFVFHGKGVSIRAVFAWFSGLWRRCAVIFGRIRDEDRFAVSSYRCNLGFMCFHPETVSSVNLHVVDWAGISWFTCKERKRSKP